MNTRMNRSRLNIGAYILAPYARTEKHIREIAECGIDFIVNMENDRPALDLMEKYGVGAIVTGILPGWWGGDGANAGQMAELCPISAYESAAERFVDHPAIWGIDTGDEPSALDFPHYGKIMRLTEQRFPNQFAYLNLYPNYASVAVNSDEQTVNQLGTATYEEHIAEYCRHVGADYLCYDFYVYSCNVPLYYANQCTVADACRRTGRSLWIVLQVNSHDETKWLSENMLRYQAYSSLAFGAENITWACYTAGWWHHQVLDERGEKTEQYEKLKKVNAELHAMGEDYMRYRCTDTHFVGFSDADGLVPAGQTAKKSLSTGVFADVREENGGKLLVGQMVAREGGGWALMLCNVDDPMDESPATGRVRFRADGYEVRILGNEGEIIPERLENGEYSFALKTCAGAFIMAK